MNAYAHYMYIYQLLHTSRIWHKVIIGEFKRSEFFFYEMIIVLSLKITACPTSDP